MFFSYKTVCAVIALTIAGSGIVLAKEKEDAGQHIYTPALQKDTSEIFTCRVVNVGKHPESVDIAILSSEGKLLETQSAVMLQPGFTSSDTATTKNTIGYCRVAVKNSPKDILVSLCSQSSTSSSCNSVVTGQFSTGD